MIVSHKYRFIFIKTRKTAGTSIEIALSGFCGPEDIITPIAPEDERLRQELGHRGPQNHFKPVREYSRRDWWWRIRGRRRALKYWNHITASAVRKRVGDDVWNTYHKLCVERNPWDKVVSFYHYLRYRDGETRSLEQFIMDGGAGGCSDLDKYLRNGKLEVDHVARYENLDEEIRDFAHRVGLPEVPGLPRAKGAFRKDKRPIEEVFTTPMRDRVAADLAQEIGLFGYTFEDAIRSECNRRKAAGTA